MPNQITDSTYRLYAQNVSSANTASGPTNQSQRDVLERLEVLAQKKIFPLKFELTKLPVIVKDPADTRYSREDNLGRLSNKEIDQRKQIAGNGLVLIKSWGLREKAKANIEEVKKIVEAELAKEGVKLSELVPESIWLAEEKQIETILLNHIDVGESKKGEVDGKAQYVRDVIITTRQNKYSLKAGSKERTIEFLKLLDDLYNEGQFEKRMLHKTTESGVLRLLDFLSINVHQEKLSIDAEGTSPRIALEQKAKNLSSYQRTLLAYYLWTLAEYARVNTHQYTLLTHSNYDSIYFDAEKLGNKAYLQNLRYLYNVLALCTVNTYDSIKKTNEELDPDISAIQALLDDAREGDEYFVSGDYQKAQKSYQEAANFNDKRTNKTPDDFYTRLIGVRQKNTQQAVDFAVEITGSANPKRDKNRKIKIDSANASSESLMYKALTIQSDKDLPALLKSKVKGHLEDVVDTENKFLQASDEKKVKVEVHNSNTGRPEKVEMSEREYYGRVLKQKIAALREHLNEVPELKNQLMAVKGIKEKFNEAKRFSQKHAAEKGVLADPAERAKAENYAKQLESIPENVRRRAGLDDFDRVLNKLKQLSQVPAPNPKTIVKDLDYLFVNLRSSFRAYVHEPSANNLRKFAEAYVPLMMVLENDSETKKILQKVLSVEETSTAKFWQYALFDPTGQNIFYKTYQQKGAQSDNVLIEAYASGSKSERVFYSLNDIKAALKNEDLSMDGENRALLGRVSQFFRDDIGRMLGIHELSDMNEVEMVRIVLGLTRLINASGSVTASQLKSNFEKHLDKELIEIGAADFSFSPSENRFKQKGDLTGLASIQSKLDEKNARHYKGNSPELFFADLFLAYDSHVKGSLSGTDSALKLSLELNNEAVPRSAMSLSIKTGQCATKEVLKQKLSLLKTYVNQEQSSDVRGKQYKKIRLALIAALAESLQIKLD